MRYTIPEEGEEETPTMEHDEVVKSDTDSDVSIEPYMADGKEQQATDAFFPDIALEETGKPVESLQWPPRVLEDQSCFTPENNIGTPHLSRVCLVQFLLVLDP